MRKRLLCFLLAVVLTAALCACGDKPSESSSEPSTAPSETSEVSEMEKDSFVENERVAQIKSMLNGSTIDRTKKAINLLAGKKYEFNQVPSDAYDDSKGTKLTDGITRDLFDSYNWVGFNKGLPVIITFDLGSSDHELAEVEVGALQQINYGIRLPAAARLSVSEDGEDWVELVSLQTPAAMEDSCKYQYRFALPRATKARYLRVAFTSSGQGFLFFDEVSAYEYCDRGVIDVQNGENAGTSHKETDYYGYSLSHDVLTPVSASDKDYDSYQNLALLSGANVQVTHFDPMTAEVCSANTPAGNISMLIDGNFASVTKYSDPAFVKFVRGCGRSVVVDLGNVMAVDRVDAEFLNQVPVGVGTPPGFMIEVSTDGENWVTTWSGFSGVYGDSSKEINYRMDAKFKKAYRARYVRLSFCTVPYNDVTSAVYMSEIEVWGKKNAEGAPDAEYDESIRTGRYPTVEEAGCENILFGSVAATGLDYGAMNVDQATELIAYLDENNDIKDYFFDSICFSGHKSLSNNDLKKSADMLIDRVFADGVNLAAANEAMGKVNKALGEDRKLGVWFSFYCPRPQYTCSDVDGDGKAEDFSQVEDRLKFLKWQVETYLKKFEEGHYDNCKVLGFYWLEEAINFSDDEKDSAAIKGISDYIHSKGLRHFWCPYYSAYGIWKWQEVGFDFACYQPNYMFYFTEESRLYSASTIAKIYGMCMEIEIEDPGSAGSCAIYRKYLREGYDSGAMNSVKMYYHGSIVGAIGSSRRQPAKHSQAIYTDTYLYAHSKITDDYNRTTGSDLDVFTDQVAEVVNGKRLTLNLADPEKVDMTEYTFRFIQCPTHATAKLNTNGELILMAMKGYDGVDTIKIEARDASGNRKVITLTIDYQR